MDSTPLTPLFLRRVQSLNHLFQPCFFGPPSETGPGPAILIDVGPANVKADRALRDIVACEIQGPSLGMNEVRFASVGGNLQRMRSIAMQ